MRWGNEHEKRLRAAGRDLLTRPADWDTEVRADFIRAHTGTDTVDTWLAKLATLRLSSKETPTPIELENQFDSYARHISSAAAEGASPPAGDEAHHRHILPAPGHAATGLPHQSPGGRSIGSSGAYPKHNPTPGNSTTQKWPWYQEARRRWRWALLLRSLI